MNDGLKYLTGQMCHQLMALKCLLCDYWFLGRYLTASLHHYYINRIAMVQSVKKHGETGFYLRIAIHDLWNNIVQKSRWQRD